MALKKCKECGQQISSEAEKCPHCGKPQSQSGTIIGVIVSLVVVVLIIYSLEKGENPINVLEGLWRNLEYNLASVDSKEINNNDIERFKNMQVAYLSEVGPTIAGISLGEWLALIQNGLKETTKLKIIENDSNIIIKIFSRESQVSFFFSPQGSNACILTKANVNGKTVSSIEALQIMMMVTPSD
jgi:hypothetical protein